MTLRPGFPIRMSTDQSLLAAPRGFSQRATSFIASWRQGIHQMPFSCLSLLALETAGPVFSTKPQVPGDQPSQNTLLQTRSTGIALPFLRAKRVRR
jgi:hypothetical protein